jgi:hypothetical protein
MQVYRVSQIQPPSEGNNSKYRLFYLESNISTIRYTNLEIAVQLVIELHTVKQHVHPILGKLNSRSRGKLHVLLLSEQGWLDRNPVTVLKRE